jgi:hypothetical protein
MVPLSMRQQKSPVFGLDRNRIGSDLLDARGNRPSKIHDRYPMFDHFPGINPTPLRIERDPMVHGDGLAVVESANAPNFFAVAVEESTEFRFRGLNEPLIATTSCPFRSTESV